MTKVTYLDHSGFAITLDDAILVFDYYRDPAHALHKILSHNPDKPVTFFATHRHPDHYNPGIFEIAQDHRRTYILSNDIPAQKIPTTLNVQGMSPGDVIENVPGCARVKAYGSTDVGLSFFVTTTSGETIFHAGDLNLWHWKDEFTDRQQLRASQKFDEVLNRIRSEVPAVDIAMFPVDPRQGTDFAEGAHRFLRAIRVRHFFPMHFWGEYEEACDFPAYADSQTTDYHCLHVPGSSVELTAEPAHAR